MDINYTIPAVLSALGFGLCFLAGMIETSRVKESYNRAASNVGSNKHGSDKQVMLYHYSREKIVGKLQSTKTPGNTNKPGGLWYAFSKKAWISFATSTMPLYKKGELLYLYSVNFVGDPKILRVKTYEDAVNLCSKISTGKMIMRNGKSLENVDWNALKNKGFDGIELSPGVMSNIQAKHPKLTNGNVTCMDILYEFAIDSGCVWNVDKIELKFIEEVVIP